jgi:hypothetical protein
VVTNSCHLMRSISRKHLLKSSSMIQSIAVSPTASATAKIKVCKVDSHCRNGEMCNLKL